MVKGHGEVLVNDVNVDGRNICKYKNNCGT